MIPSKVLILFLAACLMWIGMITLAVVSLTGVGVSVGWMIGGVLGVAILVWLVVMAGEYRNAMDDPEAFSDDDDGCGPDPDAASPTPLVFTSAADLRTREDAVTLGRPLSTRRELLLTAQTTPSARPGRRSAVPRDGAPKRQGIRAAARE